MNNLRCLGTLVLLICAATAQAAPILRAADDAGTIYLGAIVDHDWGRPVAAGDLDGDGFDEVLVAAAESFGGLFSNVYVMRGGPDAALRGTIDLVVGGIDQTIIGVNADDNLGSSIAAGDVNSDGYADLLLCASGGDYTGLTNAGIAYLIFGGPGFFASPVRDLAAAGSWDVRIVGPVADGDMGAAGFFGGFETHAADIGNLNGDSYGDIAIGVHLSDGAASGSGRVYVVAGQNFASGTTLLLSSVSHYLFRVLGKGTEDELGDVVYIADITGDGLDELIIPNRLFSQTTFSTEGAVHVLRGRTTWSAAYNLAVTPADLTFLGNYSYDELGTALAVGDFNNDGVGDLAIAAPGADVSTPNTSWGEGFIYGFLGGPAYQTGTHLIDYTFATPAFTIKGESKENLGDELTSGDVNGDGIADIIAAQRFGGASSEGTLDIVFGRPFSPNQIFLAGANTDVRIMGNAQDRIGFSLSSGDVDSNGVTDIIFGTPFNNGPSFDQMSGTVYVFNLLDGDYHVNGTLDLHDYAAFQHCYALPGAPADNGACYVFDLHPDGQLDAADVQEFTDRLTGP